MTSRVRQQSLTLRLPSGTEVVVDALLITPTYEGHLEGSRETVSEFILERLEDEERAGEIQLLRSSTPLPHYQCEVTLASVDRNRRPSILSTRLRIIWFTDTLVDSMGELLEPVRLAANFDALARSVDLDNL